jgi:hypothetical protein
MTLSPLKLKAKMPTKTRRFESYRAWSRWLSFEVGQYLKNNKMPDLSETIYPLTLHREHLAKVLNAKDKLFNAIDTRVMRCRHPFGRL